VVCADDVHRLGGREHTIYVYKYMKDLVVASKEAGVGVNAEKTKYVVVSRDQNAGRSYNIMIDNSCFERLEQFEYLEKKFNISKFDSGRN
jgi:predicted RNA-binding protein YlxR (DUF448 family)